VYAFTHELTPVTVKLDLNDVNAENDDTKLAPKKVMSLLKIADPPEVPLTYKVLVTVPTPPWTIRYLQMTPVEEVSVIPTVLVAPDTFNTLVLIPVDVLVSYIPLVNVLPLTVRLAVVTPLELLIVVVFRVPVVFPETLRVLTFTAPPTMLFAFKVPNTVKFSLTLTFGATPP
jgi:hypothetical protein